METTITNNGLYAKLKTSKGDIIIKLEYKKTPLTVANFVGLAEGTISFQNRNAERYYDGLTFHRVIENFMIQTGCPFGNGTGGPGYCFSDEFHPDLKHDNAGVLSMANAGVDTNGSQFFITHKATPHLDGKYTVFGKVVKGLETVNSITQGDKIDCIQILRIGEDAKVFKVTQAMFDRLAKEVAKKNELNKKKKIESDIKFIETKWPEVIKSVSGIMFIIKKKGNGGSPVYGDKVIVHYEGSLLNGTVFDSSIKRGEPATIEIGKVIVGWNLALVKMKKGEKRLIIIPPQLGYGERGVPGVIPSNSFLVFEVELIDFIH